MTFIPIREDMLPVLEASMPELAPWMHCLKFGDNAYVGYYKVQGLGRDECWCGPNSPPERIARLKAAYADYNAQGPRQWFAKLCGMLDIPDRSKASLIDISSATGEKSFWAAQEGFGRVISSEIRLEQHRQEQTILDCTADERYRAITAVHEPVSADDPAFPDRYEPVDVVCSFGLLYHLVNPLQHFLNLHQMSKRYVILETITHQNHRAQNYWEFVREDKSVITKAVSGVSWKPHYLAVARMAREAGFSRVDVHYPDPFAANFPDFRSGKFPVDERIRHGLLRRLGFGTDYHRRMEAWRRNHDPQYFEKTGLNPNYFYYVMEK